MVTHVNVYSEQSSNFPAVTICNQNPFTTNFSYQYLQNVTSALKLDKEMSIPSQSNNKIESIKQMLLLIANGFNLTQADKQKLANPLEQFIITCTFNMVTCNYSEFTWYFDPRYGNCYRFNSKLRGVVSVPKKSSVSGQLNGLVLEVYLGNQTFMMPLLSSSGLHVFVNNESVAPTIHEGIHLSPGFETNIEVARIFDDKLDWPYNECVKTNTNNYEYYNILTSLNQTYRQR